MISDRIKKKKKEINELKKKKTGTPAEFTLNWWLLSESSLDFFKITRSTYKTKNYTKKEK